MATDPRIALTQLVAALEKHFEAVASQRGAGDSSVERAYDLLEDAFINYEEALTEEYGEFLPIAIAEEDN
ncbi:MAG: hypothetical protein RLZZ41_450 [Actinomycetota bacterium]|jgi:hypothetical protein